MSFSEMQVNSELRVIALINCYRYSNFEYLQCLESVLTLSKVKGTPQKWSWTSFENVDFGILEYRRNKRSESSLA